jgi:hypothetical protein
MGQAAWDVCWPLLYFQLCLSIVTSQLYLPSHDEKQAPPYGRVTNKRISIKCLSRREAFSSGVCTPLRPATLNCVVLRLMTTCRLVGGYQNSEGTAAGFSETSVTHESRTVAFCVMTLCSLVGGCLHYGEIYNYTNRSTPRNTTQPGLKLQHNKDFFLWREEARDTNRQIKF